MLDFTFFSFTIAFALYPALSIYLKQDREPTILLNVSTFLLLLNFATVQWHGQFKCINVRCVYYFAFIGHKKWNGFFVHQFITNSSLNNKDIPRHTLILTLSTSLSVRNGICKCYCCMIFVHVFVPIWSANGFFHSQIL